jgi:DNA-binding protein HU-beta
MSNKRQKVILKFKDDAFVNQLASLLMKAGKVKVAGLGIFEIKEVSEREGYSIADGSRITIPAHKKLGFRPAKQLKDVIQDHEKDNGT